MKKKIITASLAILFLCTASVYAKVNEYPQITEQKCDALIPCPQGLQCYSFMDFGLRCAEADPCNYYQCPEGEECVVIEMEPPMIFCDCGEDSCPDEPEDEAKEVPGEPESDVDANPGATGHASEDLDNSQKDKKP